MPLELTWNGRALKLLALRDTGHTLTDPLTGGPVVVVEGRALAALLPGLDPDLSLQPVEQLARAREQVPGAAFQLLPYRAVGVDRGLLLALRLDRAVWGEVAVDRCLAALSPTPLSDGGVYQALVSG